MQDLFLQLILCFIAFITMAHCGWLAQLGEHLVYTERVGGSIPSPPTITSKNFTVFYKLLPLQHLKNAA